MTRDHTDHRDAGGPDERLEAIVDEALREIATPPPVNLKPAVMAAWDARGGQDRRVASPAARRPGGAWTGWGLLRPAAAVAALLLVVAASLVVWQQVGRPPRGADRAGTTSPPTAAAKPPSGEAVSPGPSIVESPGGALAARLSRPATATASRIVRRAPRPLVEVEFPVDQVAASLEHMPGAPAGDPGEGIAPLPGTPSIPITPIEQTPTVSDMSRPVSEFPAGDGSQPPGAEHGDPGQSGGPRP